jgi:hypothetical protein
MAPSMMRVFLLLLAGILVALTPLAHGSPPDPTWIAGLYDDADLDDVILKVTSSSAVVNVGATASSAPQPLMGCTPIAHEGELPFARTSPTRSRAPPVL